MWAGDILPAHLRPNYHPQASSSFKSFTIFLPFDFSTKVPHLQAVAHRDIKSRNILMQNHKSCKIADFGLALLLDYGPGWF